MATNKEIITAYFDKKIGEAEVAKQFGITDKQKLEMLRDRISGYGYVYEKEPENREQMVNAAVEQMKYFAKATQDDFDKEELYELVHDWYCDVGGRDEVEDEIFFCIGIEDIKSRQKKVRTILKDYEKKVEALTASDDYDQDVVEQWTGEAMEQIFALRKF